MDDLLAEQLSYYGARALEYDETVPLPGRGRPDVDADYDAVNAALETFAPSGDVLELAAGTGLWSILLVERASHLTAVDASAEVLARNRARLGERGDVTYVTADLFTWEPPAAAFDVCFFGFWLSHVPRDRFAPFWDTVRAALRPGGRVFVVDSGPSEQEASPPVDPATDVQERTLLDGRSFRIVKRYYTPAELVRELAAVGFEAAFQMTPNRWFIYGSAMPVRS